jgi:hypothetical protein
METTTAFLEKRLKLRVNRDKSAVERPSRRRFLGFGWIRHRLQARLGAPEWLVHQVVNSRKGVWRTSGRPMNSALGAAYWQVQGLISLSSTYRELRQPC